MHGLFMRGDSVRGIYSCSHYYLQTQSQDTPLGDSQHVSDIYGSTPEFDSF